VLAERGLSLSDLVGFKHRLSGDAADPSAVRSCHSSHGLFEARRILFEVLHGLGAETLRFSKLALGQIRWNSLPLEKLDESQSFLAVGPQLEEVISETGEL